MNQSYAGRSKRLKSPVTYFLVLVSLILLTALTVGVSFLDISGFWHIIFGVTIGGCKATLVGLFFMHLLQSRRTTWAVVFVSVFWLFAVLMMLTFGDFATRSLFPFTPGH